MNLTLNNKKTISTETGLHISEIDLTNYIPNIPFELSQFVVDVGGYSPDEFHDEREIWIITNGSGQLTYKGVMYELKAGQAVKFDSNEVHTIKNTGNKILSVISIWWKDE